MKKLFISCPMRGRSEKDIRDSMARMHKIAEITFNQELEPIQSYIHGKAPEGVNRSVWYLGESIKMLAEADYFIGVVCHHAFTGCLIETETAREYGIPSTLVDMEYLMPDAWEIEKGAIVTELLRG